MARINIKKKKKTDLLKKKNVQQWSRWELF